MRVVVDVIDAVAEIALTTGAITEFQAGGFGIGAAADGAFVAVGPFTGAVTIVLGPIRIGLCGLVKFFLPLFLLIGSALRQEVFHSTAEIYGVIQQGHDGGIGKDPENLTG